MEIKTVGVAGLGLLGRGIVACFLGHGFRVIGFTQRPETHEQANHYIATAIHDLIERADFPARLRSDWQDNYRQVSALADLGSCDFVIESVVEDLTVKQEVFDQLEAVLAADIPIASNTSAIPVTLLQR